MSRFHAFLRFSSCPFCGIPAGTLYLGFMKSHPRFVRPEWDFAARCSFNGLGEAMRTAVEKRSGCLCGISPYTKYRRCPTFKLRALQ